MNTELKQYIETEILPHAGLIDDNAPAFTDIQTFMKWISVMCHKMPISLENLQTFLLTSNADIIPKRRNIYLSYKEFDALPLTLLGTEAQGNFNKSLLTVIILPTDLAYDGEFWFLTDDEFQILNAVKNES